MYHPITHRTVRFTIAENFDYLTPGIIYRATPNNRETEVRIDRDDESSGTFLRGWQWKRLLNGAAGFERVKA